MTVKKDAVGNNPLSNLIPRGPAPRTLAPAAPSEIPAAAAVVSAPTPLSAALAIPASPSPNPGADVQLLKRCTVRLPVALLERMTSAIVHTPGMTQADFVNDAITAHLTSLEHERGEAFPVYGRRLRPGRKSW